MQFLGEEAAVVGWGHTEWGYGSQPSNSLQEVYVPIISNAVTNYLLR